MIPTTVKGCKFRRIERPIICSLAETAPPKPIAEDRNAWRAGTLLLREKESC